MPCSGRTGPLSQRGPPTAPKNTASDGEARLARLVRVRVADGVDRRSAEEPLVELEREPVRGRGALEHADRGLRDLRPDAVTGKDADLVPGAHSAPSQVVLAGRAHASNPTADGETPAAEKLLGTRGGCAHDCGRVAIVRFIRLSLRRCRLGRARRGDPLGPVDCRDHGAQRRGHDALVDADAPRDLVV